MVAALFEVAACWREASPQVGAAAAAALQWQQ
jgi:hypothetical protein